MAELKAGVGYGNITPPTGVPLARGAVYQPIISQGRRTDMETAALVMEYGSERFALLQVDLFAVSARTARRDSRRRVAPDADRGRKRAYRLRPKQRQSGDDFKARGRRTRRGVSGDAAAFDCQRRFAGR